MYRLYCDGLTLYNDRLENLKILDPSVELEENKTGSFVFGIPADHPYYGLVRRMKSIITLYQDDYLLFRGRVLDEEIGWHNEKTITCEGELAFLLDSIQRPYEYSGTVSGYLNLLVTNHNAQVEESKWFTVGNVTVTDANDYIVRSNIDYVDTWTELQSKLIDLLGGYIVVRHEGYINYIDYLQDITLLSSQPITFGKNLLDLKRIRKGNDIATALIPLGAKLKDEEGNDTDERLTIAEVNNGLDYIVDEDAKAEHTTIFRTVIFDDVTDANNLLTKGKAHMADLVNLPDTIELTAADLAMMETAFSPFHLGTQVRVESKPHGISQLFRVSKLSIKLLDHGANKLTLGGLFLGFGGALQGLASQQRQILQIAEQTARTASEAVYNVEKNLQSSITVEADNIKSVVSETYALKDETEALVSDVRVEITQTKNSYDIEFVQFRQDVEAVANGSDAQFEEIRKYIRFPDGKILLGEVGNELELQIANDRISFLQDGAEVAYFSNRKLYVTDGEYTHSLRVGRLAITPRSNGNTSINIV